MEVTYCSTYADLVRCTLYSLTNRRDVLLRLALPLAYWTTVSSHYFWRFGLLRFPMAGLAMALIMGASLFVILQFLILWRVLKPEVEKRYTTRIDPDFLSDVSLRKSKTLPWSAISEVRHKNGDTFFWQKGKDGNFVPRSAFCSPQEAQAFFETARGFWEAAKNGPPVSLPQDEAAWPPPPRITQ